MQKILLSGIKPTGNLHLGNYFGGDEAVCGSSKYPQVFYLYCQLSRNDECTRW
jgi:tryptophanyl-tRNA synthetase